MNRCLSIGVSVSVGLAMLRVVTGIPIAYILIPGYALALGLSFVVPPIFVGIAFDSGGVASGPMTTTFLLPLSIGACEMLGGNVMTDAFGVVALVALTPLIAVQLMGVAYRMKMSRVEKRRRLRLTDGMRSSSWRRNGHEHGKNARVVSAADADCHAEAHGQGAFAV